MHPKTLQDKTYLIITRNHSKLEATQWQILFVGDGVGRGKQSPPEIKNFLLHASVAKEPVTVLKENVQLTLN